MIDPEDREWSRKFGESYLDLDPEEEHLDDEQIDKLEQEFLNEKENPRSPRSPYGKLYEVDGTDDADEDPPT